TSVSALTVDPVYPCVYALQEDSIFRLVLPCTSARHEALKQVDELSGGMPHVIRSLCLSYLPEGIVQRVVRLKWKFGNSNSNNNGNGSVSMLVERSSGDILISFDGSLVRICCGRIALPVAGFRV